MTSFLIDSGSDPISVAEIKSAIGLVSDECDGAISGAIAMICCHFPGTRVQTWFVSRDPSKPASAFMTKVRRLGGEIETVGGGYHRVVNHANGMTAYGHDVTYQVKPSAVASAKAKVIEWAMNQDDISSALARQDTGHRTGTNAGVVAHTETSRVANRISPPINSTGARGSFAA